MMDMDLNNLNPIDFNRRLQPHRLRRRSQLSVCHDAFEEIVRDLDLSHFNPVDVTGGTSANLPKPTSDHLLHQIKIALRDYLTKGDNFTVLLDSEDALLTQSQSTLILQALCRPGHFELF